MKNLPAKVEQGEVVQLSQQNPIGAMMNNLMQRCETPEMLTAATATFKEMLAAYNQQEDRQAKQDFSAALAQLQADIPTLIATKEVLTKSGELKYKSKPHPEILKEIKPILARHGFSVYTDSRWDDKRGVAIIELIHKSGHSRKTEFAVIRSESSINTASETDEGTLTRAMRRGLCAALNIAVSQEDDTAASDLGDVISAEQAAIFKSRVRAIKDERTPEQRERAFLQFAGAKSFEEIRTSSLPTLEAALPKAAKPAGDSPPAKDLFAGDQYGAIKAEVQKQTGAEPSEINDAIRDLEEGGIEITVATLTKAVRI